MAKWVSSKIDIYFCDKYGTGEESSLPLLPEEFTCNIKGKNEEIDVLSVGGENNDYIAGTINLLKRPSLKTWTIDCEFSHPDKPTYENNDGEEGWTPAQWVNFFEDAMYNKKILEMTVTGINLVKEVSVEDFKHTKSAGQELDTLYTIELKEYVRSKIEHEDVKIEIVIPQPAKEVVAEKTTLGNTAWLVGYGWKSKTEEKDSIYLGMGNPYKTITVQQNRGGIIGELFKTGTYTINEYYYYFNWMPVKIVGKDPIEDPSYNISSLGTYLQKDDEMDGNLNTNFNGLLQLLEKLLPLQPKYDLVLKSYIKNVVDNGMEANRCTPGTNGKSDNLEFRIYTQRKKLHNFFRQRCNELFNDKKLSESEKINYAKQFLEETASSNLFDSKNANTDIVNMFGGKHGKMQDFIYYKPKTVEYTIYTLEAIEPFTCIDETNQEEMLLLKNTYNKKVSQAGVYQSSMGLKATNYEKGTRIYTIVGGEYKNRVETENPNTYNFSGSPGDLINSETKKSSYTLK